MPLTLFAPIVDVLMEGRFSRVPVYIVRIVVSFRAFKVWSDRDLQREKILAESGGNSLGTSELKGLIQDARREAIIPVEERLDLMEAQMRRLPSHDAASNQVEATPPDEPTEN